MPTPLGSAAFLTFTVNGPNLRGLMTIGSPGTTSVTDEVTDDSQYVRTATGMSPSMTARWPVSA